MKTYGMIVADNGSNWYVSGANTYSGGTVISGGILQLGDGAGSDGLAGRAGAGRGGEFFIVAQSAPEPSPAMMASGPPATARPTHPGVIPHP